MNLPLPLELTKPVLLAGELDTALQATYASTYDPKTQLSGGGHGGGTSCNNDTQSYDLGIVVDVKLDIQVDDILN